MSYVGEIIRCRNLSINQGVIPFLSPTPLVYETTTE